MAAEPIRILVADDHVLLREALCDVLRAECDLRVVGEAADGQAAVATASHTKPHVVLLDVEMPGSHPVITVPRLLQISPPPKVIILSAHDDPRLVQDLMRAGAHGYLHKSISRQGLFLSIRSVHHSHRRVTMMSHRRVTMIMPSSAAIPAAPSIPSIPAVLPPTGVLTERERQVLTLVAEALSNRQIAVKLSITEGTVKRHLRNIFGKLSAVSRIDAVNKALAGSQE